jgi:hypothetical protein
VFESKPRESLLLSPIGTSICKPGKTRCKLSHVKGQEYAPSRRDVLLPAGKGIHQMGNVTLFLNLLMLVILPAWLMALP